jgi:hypothetical protein
MIFILFINGSVMIFLRDDLYNEAFDGVLINLLAKSNISSYSWDWWRKNIMTDKVLSVNFSKLKLKQATHLNRIGVQQGFGQLIDIEKLSISNEGAYFPDLSANLFEKSMDMVAPISLYLFGDIVDPLSVGKYPGSLVEMENICQVFPYCFNDGFLKIYNDLGKKEFSEDVFKKKAVFHGPEYVIDSCLMLLSCHFIDRAFPTTLELYVSEFVLPDFDALYRSNYAEREYLLYIKEVIKRESSLTELYEVWSKHTRTEQESCKRKLSRWITGQGKPRPSDFFEFMMIITEMLKVKSLGLMSCFLHYLTMQLLHKYRMIMKLNGTRHEESDSYVRERVYFWHDKLTEHYSEVLKRRAAEKAQEESGPD